MTCAFGSGLGQQLLDDHDAERSLLEIAAVFEDGWTIEAAARVADLKEDTALALSEALARQSLIYAGSGPGSRSRMLDTIRAFVAEQLAARPDADQIRPRHASYFRALAEQADPALRGPGHGRWLEHLNAEAANLVAAVRWHLGHDRGPLPTYSASRGPEVGDLRAATCFAEASVGRSESAI